MIQLASTVGFSLAMTGLKQIMTRWSRQKAKQLIPDKKPIEVQTVIMPYQVSIDSGKRKVFLNHVDTLQKKFGKKINVQAQSADNIEIVKIPRHIQANPAQYKKTLVKLKQLQTRMGKRIKVLLT